MTARALLKMSGMPPLHIAVQDTGAIVILQLTGALDAANFATLTGFLQHRLRECRHAGTTPQIVLDGRQVSYVGSAELLALQEMAQLARAQDGDIKCAGFPPTVEQIATLIANGDPPEFHATVAGAVDCFRAVLA
jgi:anti-anti-sigma factor